MKCTAWVTMLRNHTWFTGGLRSKNEYTKSESNSQPQQVYTEIAKNCVQRTNIQNLKAIHNQIFLYMEGTPIVFKERIYKI